MIALQRLSNSFISTVSEDGYGSTKCIKASIDNKDWDTLEVLLKDRSIPSVHKENALCSHKDNYANNTAMEALEYEVTFEAFKVMIEYAPLMMSSEDCNGWNLLHCACYYNASAEIVQYIVDNGPSTIWSTNKSGMNVLHLASRHNTPISIVKIIIREAPQGIFACSDAEGCNLLHLTLRLNASLEIIDLILTSMPRASFFSKNDDGYEPLHYLSEHTESEKVLQLIIQRESPSLVLEALENNKDIIQFASKELLMNDHFAMAAIKRNPSGLEFASENVKADRSTILDAVKKDGNVLQFASDHLRRDRECELAAVQCTPLALAFTSRTTQENQNIVLKALEKDGNALQFAADKLRRNKDFIMTAVRTTPSSLRFALGGMNQDRDCLLATGLWDSNPATGISLPTIVMSCRLTLDEYCNYHSTLFGIFMKEHVFFEQFGIYHQNPWSVSSCDPNGPCRGTCDTCKHALFHQNTIYDQNQSGISSWACDDSKRTRDDLCWRYNTRCRLEKAKLNGGMMIQVSEWVPTARNHLLGPRQETETEMATEVGIKIFRVMQNQNADRSPVPFNQQHVSQVGRKILAWDLSGREDMDISKIYVV